MFDEVTERRFSLKELNELYYNGGVKVVKQLHAGLLGYILWYNPDAFPLLDFGNSGIVKAVYGLDRLFMTKGIGRKLSIATFSVLQKMRD